MNGFFALHPCVDARTTNPQGHAFPRPWTSRVKLNGAFRVQGSGFGEWGLHERRRQMSSVKPMKNVKNNHFTDVLWYRGGLVFEAHRLLYHSA